MDEWQFLEVKLWQNWTSGHYNPRRAQQNIRYIDQGRWSVDYPSDDLPRNLGVIFDSTCCLDARIAKLCRSINFNLYSVGEIRKYLDGPTAKKMINATVTSRLDYCNSLLYGAKQSHIDRLQCCQNNAATIISKRRKFDHISPVLRKLHWLPVEHRISYKILLLTYKALNGHAPQYLTAIISKYVPPQPLRSKDQYLSPRPFGTLYPSVWSKLHLLTLSRPGLKLTCSTKHFDSLYV